MIFYSHSSSKYMAPLYSIGWNREQRIVLFVNLPISRLAASNANRLEGSNDNRLEGTV